MPGVRSRHGLPRRGKPRMSDLCPREASMSATRIAIAGLGAIGRALARRLTEGVPGVTLACAAARDRAKAQAWLDEQRITCPLVELDEFPQYADMVIECAPAAALEDICRPMLQA